MVGVAGVGGEIDFAEELLLVMFEFADHVRGWVVGVLRGGEVVLLCVWYCGWFLSRYRGLLDDVRDWS